VSPASLAMAKQSHSPKVSTDAAWCVREKTTGTSYSQNHHNLFMQASAYAMKRKYATVLVAAEWCHNERPTPVSNMQ